MKKYDVCTWAHAEIDATVRFTDGEETPISDVISSCDEVPTSSLHYEHRPQESSQFQLDERSTSELCRESGNNLHRQRRGGNSDVFQAMFLRWEATTKSIELHARNIRLWMRTPGGLANRYKTHTCALVARYTDTRQPGHGSLICPAQRCVAFGYRKDAQCSRWTTSWRH